MKRFWLRAFDFSGRSSRREFRCGILWSVLLALPGISTILFGTMTKNDLVLTVGIGLHLFIALFWIIPFVALCVRREHDLGRSGWRFLLDGRDCSHLWFQTSDPEANRYGPPPADAKK